VLSDAAFVSVLTSSYRANLLLPQLKPPVSDVSQANRDAVARADAQQARQNANNRQLSVNAAKRTDAQYLATASLERAALLRIASRPVSKGPPQVDRVTISRVSEIAKETLANAVLSSAKGAFVPAPEVRVAESAPPKTHYSPRDIAVVQSAAPVAAPVLALVAGMPQSTISRRDIVAQQYRSNDALPASAAVSQGGGSASSGVNVRA